MACLDSLCKLLPRDQKNFLHRAFLALLANQTLKGTGLADEIKNYATIQEARDMLAERGGNLKRSLIARGRMEERPLAEARGEARGKAIGEARGEARGIKEAITEILANRFGGHGAVSLPQIDDISDIAFLKFLMSKALQMDSIDSFKELLKSGKG